MLLKGRPLLLTQSSFGGLRRESLPLPAAQRGLRRSLQWIWHRELLFNWIVYGHLYHLSLVTFQQAR